MAADVDPPRRLPRQHRHHVAQLDVARDAAARGNLVRVEADLQLRAACASARRRSTAAPRRCRAWRTPDPSSVLRVPKLDELLRAAAAAAPRRSTRRASAIRGSIDRPRRRRRLRARTVSTGTASTAEHRQHQHPQHLQHPAHPQHLCASPHLDVFQVVARRDARRAAERRVVEVDPGRALAAVGQRDVRLLARGRGCWSGSSWR